MDICGFVDENDHDSYMRAHQTAIDDVMLDDDHDANDDQVPLKNFQR